MINFSQKSERKKDRKLTCKKAENFPKLGKETDTRSRKQREPQTR